MKKIYIQPSIEVHKIKTANMIAESSPNNVIINRNGNINASEVGSRGGSVWDDDED